MLINESVQNSQRGGQRGGGGGVEQVAGADGDAQHGAGGADLDRLAEEDAMIGEAAVEAAQGGEGEEPARRTDREAGDAGGERVCAAGDGEEMQPRVGGAVGFDLGEQGLQRACARAGGRAR